MDAHRLSEFFDAHSAALLLYARQWLDRSAAEDVVQEVYVRLLLQIAEPANARAWLFKAVRNEAISQTRSFQRRRQREQKSTREEWFIAADQDWLDGTSAREAMESLLAGQRETIVLRIWAGMSFAEIAAIVGSPISTVFDHYRQGLDEIRKKMGEPCQNRNE